MKKVLAIILAIAIFMMAIPLSFSATTVADDNRVMFTPTVNESAVSYDADGKLSYGAANGLGWTQAGILKKSNGIDYTTNANQSYLFADEIDGETMWKIDFNVDTDIVEIEDDILQNISAKINPENCCPFLILSN